MEGRLCRMALVSYEERQQHWEWCRKLIDDEAIYRADDKHPPIPSKANPDSNYIWQFYLRRATYNPDFAYKLGVLFWDHFLPVYQQQPFQVCACNPSGPPIGMAIVAIARYANVPINLFVVRREPKKFGFQNWFEGQVTKLPVLIVDDVASSTEYMREAAARVKVKLGLPLHRNYFAIVNKVGRNVAKAAQHTENLLDNELVSLFTLNNFCKTVREYKDRYGRAPEWTGVAR